MKATQANPISLDTDDLIEYLKENPNIFQQQPELLELVSLSDSRGTASLLERQVEMLKERLKSFQSEKSELIQVARENEQISESFTQIICQLIAYENLSEFTSEFPVALRNTFDIQEVSFKTAKVAEHRPNDSQGYEEAARRLTNQRSVCDDRWPSSIMKLFFSDAIKSAALVPMCTKDSESPLGILALGSTDVERYNNDLGTAHLDRLGLMSGLCLARLLPNDS